MTPVENWIPVLLRIVSVILPSVRSSTRGGYWVWGGPPPQTAWWICEQPLLCFWFSGSKWFLQVEASILPLGKDHPRLCGKMKGRSRPSVFVWVLLNFISVPTTAIVSVGDLLRLLVARPAAPVVSVRGIALLSVLSGFLAVLGQGVSTLQRSSRTSLVHRSSHRRSDRTQPREQRSLS